MPITDSDLNHIFKHTEKFWHMLAEKSVFITGGTGFFGKWLLESFIFANKSLDLKARMLVLSRDPDAFKTRYPHLTNKSVDFLKGDVRDFDFLDQDYDYIIHAATDSSVRLHEEDSALISNTIIDGTKQVLDLAQNCHAKRLLYISSGAVYGKQPSDLSHLPEDYHPASETHGTASAYGEGKKQAEILCAEHQQKHSLEIPVARCFAFVGPYLNLDIHFAIGNFIRDGLNGDIINVNGDGTPYRSYLYAADLAIWLWTILFKGKSGRTYNVGSDHQISIAELANTVSACFSHHPEVRIAKTPEPDRQPLRYVPSIERAKHELSLDCYIDLKESIKRTISFYKQIELIRKNF